MINLLKKLLGTQKWIIAFMSLVLFLSALLLILIGSFNLVINCITLYSQLHDSHQIHIESVATDFLHIIDIYLLAIFFYTFSAGIYQLFIGEHELARWLNIKTLEDLKGKLASMIILLLATLFVQEVTLWKDDLLQAGIGIAAISGVLIWFTYILREKK